MDIGEVQGGALVIHCDGSSAIAISMNPIFHRKTKHIKVKYYFVGEAQNDSEVKLVDIIGEN